jgi:hypothetical protein
VQIEGRFVRKRVPPIEDRGVFKGDGTRSIADDVVRVAGRRIPSENARLALGFAWFFGLLFVAAYALILAYPEGVSGQTGLSIPIIAFACIAANYFHWVKEDLEFPISRVSAVATDSARSLLAISIVGKPNSSPIVMRVNDPATIRQALQQLKPAAAASPP